MREDCYADVYILMSNFLVKNSYTIEITCVLSKLTYAYMHLKNYSFLDALPTLKALK